MTQDFRDVIALFGMASIGKEFKPDHTLNVSRIYDISIKHGVWQTVYLALSKFTDLSSFTPQFLSAVSKNIQRNTFVFGQVEQLNSAGIECAFIKGITVARFYSNPECRISGDADILIDKKDEPRVREILSQNGFELEKNVGNMYHFEARHSLAGLVEVHTALYQENVRDMLFDDMLQYNEPYISIEVDGHSVKALGINDGLNHLTAHYLKHFINKGVGIRQLMDILLYMQHYKNDIDWASYKTLWKKIGFYPLIEKLMGIGNAYWGMDFADASFDNIDDILDDIENGGIFGFNEKERADFLNVFLAEKNKDNIDNLEDYMKKYNKRTFWKRFFPNKEKMRQRGYAYASKGGVYLLAAWTNRLFDQIRMLFKGKKNISNTIGYTSRKDYSEKEKNRLELMRKAGLLKEKE